MRSARNREDAYAYLKATNGGRTPDDVIRALAGGMCELEAYVRELARVNDAKVVSSIEENEEKAKANDPYRRRISANYPLPGTEAFYHTSVVDVPGFDPHEAYPWANGAPNGPKLFKVVHDNVNKAGVEVRLGAAAGAFRWSVASCRSNSACCARSAFSSCSRRVRSPAVSDAVSAAPAKAPPPRTGSAVA